MWCSIQDNYNTDIYKVLQHQNQIYNLQKDFICNIKLNVLSNIRVTCIHSYRYDNSKI